MKTIPVLCVLALLLGRPAAADTNDWRQSDHALARLSGTNILWQIIADPAQGKPYFHPLATPNGTCLTDLRPTDHPWHRGLWFSWKFINGLNYWEENRLTQKSDGATELVDAKLEPHDDGSATLKFSLRYHPWNEPAVLTEQRTLEVSAPDNGSYEIRWRSEFTAVTNVTLSRTPLPGEPGGAAWGGYAGLSLRLNPATRNWIFSNSDSRSGVTALHGKPADWVKFSAGPHLPVVAIFDDAQNVRHPSPWYVNQTMPFFSPAPLFAQSLTLLPGGVLRLQYRIHITDHDDLAQPTK